MGHPSATSPARRTVEHLLEDARSGLKRLDPHQAHAAMAVGATLVDIRSEIQRAADGVVPGAVHVPRNVLEWRCDPSCPAHDPRVGGLGRRLVIMCNQGYQSSLSAATLQRLGFARATDLIGGFQAWRATGLPVHQLAEPPLVRAIDCPCGHHLEGADDDELLRLASDHAERDHPDLQRDDGELRERIAAEAYDVRASYD